MGRKFKRQNDDNFGRMADAVASKIIKDYAGLKIDANDQQIMTDQLRKRIARALRAFHHREGHHEEY